MKGRRNRGSNGKLVGWRKEKEKEDTCEKLKIVVVNTIAEWREDK